MADSDGNGVTGVKYQLYLNEKCALDGDEVKVGRERSVNINANENKEILIGNMDIPAEEFGCGPSESNYAVNYSQQLLTSTSFL